jgi:uncharacterized protein YprB with RNaseH-like and TPR domain
MYLFFDTETTGLPGNWKAPVTDVNNWLRLDPHSSSTASIRSKTLPYRIPEGDLPIQKIFSLYLLTFKNGCTFALI